MKLFAIVLMCVVATAFQGCGDRPKPADAQQGADSRTETVADNPRSTAGMQLKGPVKTMTKHVYTANLWMETLYEFAEDGHLTTIVEDLSSCGDQRTVRFDEKGAVVDTTYHLEGCYDPDDAVELEPEAPQRYTGEYSEVTDDYLIGAWFNDQGCMTRYHLNNGKDSLTMEFLYDKDQTTLTRISYDLVREDGATSRVFVFPQCDEYGNPLQWAVSAPREPFPAEVVDMVEEFIPALFVEVASYSYYKQ